MLKATSNKRKEREEDSIEEPKSLQNSSLPLNGNLELNDESGDEQSDEEDSDGVQEPFPELDPASDSDSDSFDEEDVEGLDEDEESYPDDSGSDTSVADDVTPFPKPRTIISNITGQPKRVYPEIEPDYDSDSSTEEDPTRIGNVPVEWYDDLPHVGYDINGKKVLRAARGDELDKFLSTVEDPSTWTSAMDKKLGMEKPLTAEELDIIQRLQSAENPDANYDPYEPTVEWFTGKGKEEVMPLSSAPEPKRRWQPSKWEKQKVMKIVRAIRQGRILPSKPKTSSDAPQYYNIWSNEDPSSSHVPQLPAPKRRLPTNSESYNPPPEYLPSEEEKKQWEETEKEDRERDYLPQSYPSLRLVPAYDQFIQEQFQRQLDLYLAPRLQKKKLNIDPESLIPKLPSPNSLKPFPLYKSLRVMHESRVRCISVSPDGLWSVTGDGKGHILLWEVTVGRPVKRWKFDAAITAVEWCPRKDVTFFVVALEETLHAIIPPNLSEPILKATRTLLAPSELPANGSAPTVVKWTSDLSGSSEDKPILSLRLPASSGSPKQVVFHRRGDYFATVCDAPGQISIWIHQISKRHSQSPFKKMKGAVQRVLFHPIKAHFLVATQRYVRIYDLAAQQLLKTLQPGMKWISSIDIHPSGDHLIVGGYDRKLCWFDLELSDKPYKVLRYHTRAIRAVHFHPTYPLFASSSDDGSIQIFHARVYNDMMTDPLIVPLKILRGHKVSDGLGVLDIKWCSGSPWLVSAGADGTAGVWFS
ncbi:BOP1NT-domain-containing protein [Sistotremastrum niveocremeum HHB9708]|uniref:Ribosome biogenesis protein ERB1 n=1 Tax=Sistotremastrum niveocremeum HHB9708 TaxID=1314777 RepID=A0A164ZSF1_9AGAM|nr:BOP1NT-domain-containing protein [Sistotremastrum niveocremeum HHB9708]